MRDVAVVEDVDVVDVDAEDADVVDVGAVDAHEGAQVAHAVDEDVDVDAEDVVADVVNAWTGYTSPWGQCLFYVGLHYWTSIPSQEYGLLFILILF